MLTQICGFVHQIKVVADAMNTLSTKMVKYMDRKAHANEVQLKSIAGGAGYFGIAVTVCASVMIIIQAQIAISICEMSPPTLRRIKL